MWIRKGEGESLLFTGDVAVTVSVESPAAPTKKLPERSATSKTQHRRSMCKIICVYTYYQEIKFYTTFYNTIEIWTAFRDKSHKACATGLEHAAEAWLSKSRPLWSAGSVLLRYNSPHAHLESHRIPPKILEHSSEKLADSKIHTEIQRT